MPESGVVTAPLFASIDEILCSYRGVFDPLYFRRALRGPGWAVLSLECPHTHTEIGPCRPGMDALKHVNYLFSFNVGSEGLQYLIVWTENEPQGSERAVKILLLSHPLAAPPPSPHPLPDTAPLGAGFIACIFTHIPCVIHNNNAICILPIAIRHIYL